MEKKIAKSHDLLYSSNKKWQARGRQIIRKWKKSNRSQQLKHAFLNEAPNNTEAAILYSHMIESATGNTRIHCAASFEAGLNFQLFKSTIETVVRTLRAETRRREFIEPIELMTAKLSKIIEVDSDDIGHPHNGALIEFGQLFVMLIDSFQLRHPDLSAADLERCIGNMLRNYITKLK